MFHDVEMPLERIIYVLYIQEVILIKSRKWRFMWAISADNW
jgi:hypothetical protein